MSFSFEALRGLLSKDKPKEAKQKYELTRNSDVQRHESGLESPSFPRWRMTFMSSEEGSLELDHEFFGSTFSMSESLNLDAARLPVSKTITHRPSSVGDTYRRIHRNFTVGKSIHLAALAGDLREVQRLINNGVDIHKPDHLGNTPLMCGVLAGSLAVVELLIQMGAEAKREDNMGNTTLHSAIQTGNEDIVKLLLNSGSQADVNKIGSGGLSPLQLAAQSDHAKLCKLLADYGAQLDCNHGNALTLAVLKGSKDAAACLFDLIDERNMKMDSFIYDVDDSGNSLLHLAVESSVFQSKDGSTPFHCACALGNLDVVKRFYEQDKEALGCIPKDNQGMSPLHRAAGNNHAKVVKFLLEKEFPVNPRDAKCRTPLLLASAVGGLESVKVLLEFSADVTVKDFNLRSVLHLAIGHNMTLEALLKVPISKQLIKEKDVHGFAPIHYAVQSGSLQDVSLLISYDMVVTEVVSDSLDTALHLAARHGFSDITGKLLENRNERLINAENNQKRTALHLACMEGHHAATAVLVTDSAIQRDINQRSPLHLAATQGSLKCVELVIKFHPDCLNSWDRNENTAIHLAAIAGHAHIVQYLMSFEELLFMSNARDKNALDLAIDHGRENVAMVMIEHKRWKEALHSTISDRQSQIESLVQKMPRVVERLLDHCIVEEGQVTDYNYKVTYDLRLIQGMDANGDKTKHSLNHLRTMVKYKREKCIGHPVCYSLMSLKWKKFGWVTFMLNFFMFFLFLLVLTYFAVKSKAEWINKCDSECKNQRLKYFWDASSYMDWSINLLALVYLISKNPGCLCKTPLQMHAVALGLFLGWLNLVLYLRRLSTYGRFVVMLMTMIQTLLKVIILFILFILAFGISFYILMGNNQNLFGSLPKSLMKTFIMTLGELNFEATYINKDVDVPFLNFGIFILFALVMPIILMNMLIGLAVGDIDNIQKNAVMDRYRVQVALLLELEESLPKWLLRRLTVKEHAEYPNHLKTIWTKMWMLFCDLGRVQGNEYDQGNHVSVTLSQLKDKVDEQEIRSKEMERILHEHLQVLNEMNRRLRGSEEGTGRRIMNWFGLR
ncbi:hypothetical protein pdam_00002233 [Pocillopora damicornis]|uniref:Ion transport domain-containing protein n=1 Tax=Pocillopora damicornis TaxID=46731 RepID=A0A3M6TFL3_POCDA|nr:hypothetical protein pdam_00002233 [Pocillopora damicornis]